jgi:hypothetical protein
VAIFSSVGYKDHKRIENVLFLLFLSPVLRQVKNSLKNVKNVRFLLVERPHGAIQLTFSKQLRG